MKWIIETGEELLKVKDKYTNKDINKMIVNIRKYLV